MTPWSRCLCGTNNGYGKRQNDRMLPIAIDGIAVGDLDYIDIGTPMGITEVIPVTVKSLMFPGTRSQ
jgi:ethanolamine utilization protein EutA (predicted chaperonin)